MVIDQDYHDSLVEQIKNIQDLAASKRMIFLLLNLIARLEEKVDNNFYLLKGDINTLFRER